VLVNLLLNAGAAMGGRGRIVVAARVVPGSQSGPSEVELTVDDEGPGIKEADLVRIFDPFFTTSGGTGLGLSVSYGIVAAHGGRIWAQNRSEGGARFAIRLPWKGNTKGSTT
jgi:signal transduction histidine kinase